jgi:hypothetical protein
LGVATVRAWEAKILAWHATDGCSTGRTEAVNLLIQKVIGSVEPDYMQTLREAI